MARHFGDQTEDQQLGVGQALSLHHMTNKDTADSATGQKQLRRLETFLDVAYAVLFVEFIMYLPSRSPNHGAG